jgi:hypothetical protein
MILQKPVPAFHPQTLYNKGLRAIYTVDLLLSFDSGKIKIFCAEDKTHFFCP